MKYQNSSLVTFSKTVLGLLSICISLVVWGQNGQQSSPANNAATPSPYIQIDATSGIDFPVEFIPHVQAPMPVIRLSVQAAPESFIRDVLNKQGKNTAMIGQLSKIPQLSSQQIPDSYIGLMERGHLTAYWNRESGDAEIFPILGDQKPEIITGSANAASTQNATADPLAAKVTRASGIAKQIFARQDILPKDATEFVVGDPVPIMGATAEKAAGQEKVAESGNSVYLLYAPVRRTVNGYKVHGPGSRALVAIGNDGSVQGFLRRWKVGSADGEISETRTPEEVRSEIVKQLTPLARNANVSVISVELAYYDNDQNSIQPIYLTTVRVHHIPQDVPGIIASAHTVNDNYVVSYVPVGSTIQAVATPTPGIGYNGSAPPSPTPAPQGTPHPGSPIIGRYVVRNDDPSWEADSQEFWNGLNGFSQTIAIWASDVQYVAGSLAIYNGTEYEVIESHTSQTGWEPPNAPALWQIAGPIEPTPMVGIQGPTAIDAQDYWAYPYEFNTNAISFANSVNIAVNEVHGDWWYFTTYQNWGDGVDITQITPSQGFGGANQGHLAYWVLHSCEVVPSVAEQPCPYDTRPWWTPWYNVFQGLHTVVGYRTIMYIDDDVGGPFGANLRAGAPVVAAWFNATLSAPLYQNGATMWGHCANAPLGRPSTVSVCGHQDDTIFEVNALPPAQCLVNLWQPN